MTKNISVIAILAAVVVVVVFLPVEVAYDFTVDGKVVPVREWAVYRSRNDGIETALRDNLRGGVTQYSVNRFEGGDAARLTIDPGLRAAAIILEGDTVASIYSSDLAREYASLAGELGTALASLDLYTTGEKSPIVEEERLRLAQAEEVARQHQLELDRLRRLRTENLISEQELEFSESEQRVLNAGVEVAAARYESVRSGAKPEQVEFTRSEVRSLRQEIDAMATKLRLSTIVSPIAGRVSRSFGPDTLLSAYDTTAFVVIMAVPVERMDMVHAGDAVVVSATRTGGETSAEIYQLDGEVHMVRERQMFLVHAIINNPPRTLLPGSRVTCEIDAGRIPLILYLKEILSGAA